MTREAPSYGYPQEALKGAIQWLNFLCEGLDVDPEETNFLVTARDADGEVIKQIEVNLAESLAEFKRVADLYEPEVFHVDAAPGEEHENSREGAEE